MITMKKQPKLKNKIGIIFVAKSNSSEQIEMTQQAINTARQYANCSIDFDLDIIVAEENEKHKEYIGAEVFHHKVKPFNYNKILNKTRKKFKDYDFILFSNNDVIFTENWLENLLKNDGLCLSPKEPEDLRQRDILEDTAGYRMATHFSGWCFGLRKEAMEKIGNFNEDFTFWFSDNVVADQLKEAGIEPILVVKSIVKHLGSKTLGEVEKDEKYKMTYGDVDKYEKQSGEQTEISMKAIGRTREGRILANQMLPKI